MFSREILKQIVLAGEILAEPEFEEAANNAKNENRNIVDYLFEKKIINPQSLYEAAANFYNIPLVSLKNKVVNPGVLELIPEIIASTHQIIAFEANDTEVSLATSRPGNLEIVEFIKKKLNKEVKINLATPKDIADILKQYHKSLSTDFNALIPSISEEKEDLKKIANEISIVKVVDTILEHAIFEEASDIHIEPGEKEITVRYRIDGILRKIMELPKSLQSGISARIKILADLKVDEKRLPQDGRFKIASQEYKMAFRVSIIPTFDGEKIVMRLLNEKAQVLTLEQLGFHPKAYKIVKNNIEKPHGIILVTGPTGSGKTTTLYTVLNILNKPEVNISTIEDPIEYRMENVNQSQVNPKIGYTFAAGLRAFLRQDPNIIMVGEIRDQETAEIAMNAAMTGHLVLSTLHTNDAVVTLPRLEEMGIPSFLISSTVNIIIAQRLTRRICPQCIQSYKLPKEIIEELNTQFNMGDILAALEREKVIKDAKGGIEDLLFYRGKGCPACRNTGYKGRIGIYEVLEVNDAISDLILKKAPLDEIRKKAVEDGMLSIIEDGFIKAKNGLTTIEEIIRVTKE